MASRQTYSLSSAELAVLIDHMTGGSLLEGSTTLPELRVEEQALEKAEESLLDKGLLLSLPFEETAGVTSQLASVLSAALTPERVCIVRTIQEERTDPPVVFSFTPECITQNHVDARRRHVFRELADREEALEAILSAGGALDAPEGHLAEPQPVAELLPTAHRLVTLLAVSDPAELGSVAYSLAWLETKESLWLVWEAGDGDQPLAQAVDSAALRRRVEELLESQASDPG